MQVQSFSWVFFLRFSNQFLHKFLQFLCTIRVCSKKLNKTSFFWAYKQTLDKANRYRCGAQEARLAALNVLIYMQRRIQRSFFSPSLSGGLCVLELTCSWSTEASGIKSVHICLLRNWDLMFCFCLFLPRQVSSTWDSDGLKATFFLEFLKMQSI